MIVVNQVRCLKCGDTPFSRHRHDYVTCKCGAVSVDGGMDYLRRAGDIGAYEEMSYSLPTPLVHELSTKTEGLRGTLEEDDPHLAKDITTGLLKILSKRKRLNKDTPITDDVRVACLNAVQWGIDTRRNGLGIALALTRALKDHNCLLVGDE